MFIYWIIAKCKKALNLISANFPVQPFLRALATRKLTRHQRQMHALKDLFISLFARIRRIPTRKFTKNIILRTHKKGRLFKSPLFIGKYSSPKR